MIFTVYIEGLMNQLHQSLLVQEWPVPMNHAIIAIDLVNAVSCSLLTVTYFVLIAYVYNSIQQPFLCNTEKYTWFLRNDNRI